MVARRIDVLLATYRPDASMLKALLDSVCVQEDVSVNLIRREDETEEGARANFTALLTQSHAGYVAFADQDDVWCTDKLVKCLAKLETLESRYGRETPLLVFCDGRVTDCELNPYSGTTVSRQGVDVSAGLAINRLLMQNFIAGNAMLFNAALREKAGPVPSGALMHDSWLALVAAAFGHIGFVDEPLYFYRQHGANALGATTGDARHAVQRACEGVGAFRARLQANVLQARAFVERFGSAAPACAWALAHLPEMSFLGRRRAILQNRLFKQGLLRNLALLAFA